MRLSHYLQDFRRDWRPLLATSLGLSSGMALHPFVMNVLAPRLVEGLGWSRADFALTAIVSGLAILSYPIVGRLADRYGVRRIGALGVLATVSSYLAIAALSGPIGYYVAILVLQLSLGAMTTGPVFLRMIVGTFDRSRGVALAVAVSAPAVVAALGSPLLAALIESAGWRTGAFSVALYALVTGALALVLVPPGQFAGSAPADRAGAGGTSLRALLQRREYRLLVLVTMLVSLPLAMTNSQLALVLADNGLSVALAGGVVGLFAMGTIAGRLLAGLALDRFSAERVGAVAFCLPAIGMLLIASPLDQLPVLALAILVMGLAFGAEGDVLAYIASRQFGLEAYGTALGILFASVGVASMLGALLLSQSLRLWESYTPFLCVAALAVLAGSLLLLKLGPASMSCPAGSVDALGEA